MNCNECKEKRKSAEPVSYFAYESAVASLERIIKRMWALMLVLIILLAGSNAVWIYWNSQFKTVETTITQENKDGYNNYIGNDGDIVNGNTDNQDKKTC